MAANKKITIKNLSRALRLPFLSASVLPFIFGSLYVRENFHIITFLFGLGAVIATHLSANLMNDYADSKSGADWQDKNFYKFFGGSKLIQEKVFSELFFKRLAAFTALAAGFCVLGLSITLKASSVVGYYLVILLLGWSYSHKPLQFSYRRCGEFIIFLTFGPALVMGGYFIQTKLFPDMKSFLLSVPFGIFTTAILFANEIPDYSDDVRAKKMNWVSILGLDRAYVFYRLLVVAGFISIVVLVQRRYVSPFALCSLLGIFPAVKAIGILKHHYLDKTKLMLSSKLTICIQVMVSVIMIAAIFIR
ncbi:MAG: prenyltransferase [Candidatus Omnitrophota bacterium]